jgi:hypothetical protein
MALSFSESIAAGKARLLKEANDKCYLIATELFESIVVLSPSPSNPGPWATGLLANQWYPLEGGSFSSALTGATSATGADSLGRIRSLRQKGKEFLGKDGVLTLSNNVPHAALAEYIGWLPPRWIPGHAPYRMVSISLQKIVAKYK